MTTVSLKLPDELLRELEEAASKRGESKSTIIRESLEAALRKGRRSKAKPSCLDLVRDVVGHVSGPRDASTNPRYLAEAVLSDHKRGKKNHR